MPYTNDYYRKLTASEISKDTKIPQQTVSRILNQLSQINIIDYEIRGKNKLFYIKNQLNNIISILENIKSLLFQLQQQEITIILNEILNHCDSIILFGSYANENYNENSDIDLVIINGKKEEIKKIKNKYPIEINEEYLSYSELKKIHLNNPLLKEIKTNHIIFGEIDKIVKIFKNER